MSSSRISDKIAAIALYADLFSSTHCLHIIVVFHFLVWFIRVAWNSLSLFLYLPYLGRELIENSLFEVYKVEGLDFRVKAWVFQDRPTYLSAHSSHLLSLQSWFFDLQEKWNQNSPWWPSFNGKTSSHFSSVWFFLSLSCLVSPWPHAALCRCPEPCPASGPLSRISEHSTAFMVLYVSLRWMTSLLGSPQLPFQKRRRHSEGAYSLQWERLTQTAASVSCNGSRAKINWVWTSMKDTANSHLNVCIWKKRLCGARSWIAAMLVLRHKASARFCFSFLFSASIWAQADNGERLFVRSLKSTFKLLCSLSATTIANLSICAIYRGLWHPWWMLNTTQFCTFSSFNSPHKVSIWKMNPNAQIPTKSNLFAQAVYVPQSISPESSTIGHSKHTWLLSLISSVWRSSPLPSGLKSFVNVFNVL